MMTRLFALWFKLRSSFGPYGYLARLGVLWTKYTALQRKLECQEFQVGILREQLKLAHAQIEAERLSCSLRSAASAAGIASQEAVNAAIAMLRCENERLTYELAHCGSDLDVAQARIRTLEAELAAINESKSPCGHWAVHAVTSDGGKHIECLECKNVALETEVKRLTNCGDELARLALSALR